MAGDPDRLAVEQESLAVAFRHRRTKCKPVCRWPPLVSCTEVCCKARGLDRVATCVTNEDLVLAVDFERMSGEDTSDLCAEK